MGRVRPDVAGLAPPQDAVGAQGAHAHRRAREGREGRRLGGGDADDGEPEGRAGEGADGWWGEPRGVEEVEPGPPGAGDPEREEGLGRAGAGTWGEEWEGGAARWWDTAWARDAAPASVGDGDRGG